MVAAACVATLMLIAWAVYMQFSDSSFSARFCLFFALYALVAAAGILFRRSDDILEPFFAIIFLFTTYSWCAAWNIDMLHEAQFSQSVMATYYACITAGLISFMVGYCYCASRRRLRQRAPARIPAAALRKLHYFCIAATLGLGFLNRGYLARTFDPRQIVSYTAWATISRKDALENPWSGLVGAGETFTASLLTACLLLPMFTKRRLAAFGFTAACVWAGLGLMAGSKTALIVVVLSAVIYRHYYVRPLRLRSLVLLGAILYVPLTMLNHVRNTTDLGLMVSNAVQMATSDARFLSPAGNGELAGPPVTLMRIIEAIDAGQMNYSYGLSYLSEILTFIPRAIYRNRPLPLSLQYMSTFYPVEMLQGQGFGFFIPTEGYWALGIAGVCLEMAVFGAILGVLYRSFRANLHNGAWVFIYMMVWLPGLISSIRTGLIGTVKSTLMVVAPLLVLWFLSRRRRKGVAEG